MPTQPRKSARLNSAWRHPAARAFAIGVTPRGRAGVAPPPRARSRAESHRGNREPSASRRRPSSTRTARPRSTKPSTTCRPKTLRPWCSKAGTYVQYRARQPSTSPRPGIRTSGPVKWSESEPAWQAGHASLIAARSGGTSLLRGAVSWRVTFAILPSLPVMPATA
jgi:hypothetical protein